MKKRNFDMYFFFYLLKNFVKNIEVRKQVVNKIRSPLKKYYFFFDFFALPEKFSQVSQVEYSQAVEIWDLMKNKIKKASVKMQSIYSLQNFYAMFINLNYVLKTQINQGYNEDNLFYLLCDPCYLVYSFVQLKINKKISSGIDFVPIQNVTLGAILNLSKKIRNKKYNPAPMRKIYIPKSNGQMRPLSIASCLDKILQKGILIILQQIFEPIFQNVSHGYRPHRSCHTALHSIYYR
jgi:hypothetical protein